MKMIEVRPSSTHSGKPHRVKLLDQDELGGR